jgi:hypothetical protein
LPPSEKQVGKCQKKRVAQFGTTSSRWAMTSKIQAPDWIFLVRLLNRCREDSQNVLSSRFGRKVTVNATNAVGMMLSVKNMIL